MDLARPISSVVPSLDGEVLVILARTTRALTGRQVHRSVRRGSQSGVNNVLVRLARQGLVEVSPGGAANLYTLNRDHVAAPVVTELANLRGLLLNRLSEAIAAWPQPPLAAAVFGSVARGDGDLDSDIDLLLVRPPGIDDEEPVWAQSVSELSRDGRRWSGNAMSILQVSVAQLTALIDSDAAIVGELRSDAIGVFGPFVLDVAGRR